MQRLNRKREKRPQWLSSGVDTVSHLKPMLDHHQLHQIQTKNPGVVNIRSSKNRQVRKDCINNVIC
jgi:hypothetical protein